MAIQTQLRRGTTSQHGSFTGAVGEVTVDTDKDTLKVHDGSTAGGHEITQNAATQTLTNKTLTSPKINDSTTISSTGTELNLLDGSVPGTVVNSKAVIYTSGGVVNATDVAVSGSGNRSVSITSTDGIASMEIGGVTGSFIDLKVPSSDDFDVRLSGGATGGSIQIAGGTFSISGSGETMATFVDDGGVTLYNDNTARLVTTSVGAEITGDLSIASTVDSDNADLGEINFWNKTNAGSGSGTSFVNDVAAIQGQMEGTGNNSGGSLHFFTKADGGSKTQALTITGDQKVGVGTTAPDSLVEIASGGATTAKVSTSATNSYAEWIFEDGNAGYGLQVRSDNAQSTGTGSLLINDRDTGTFPVVIKEGNATDTLVLTGSKVGIGTSTPANWSGFGDDLVISGSAQTGITINSENSTKSVIHFADGTSGTAAYMGFLDYDHASNYLALGANGAEKARLNSTGLGVGTTAPSAKLHVVNGAAKAQLSTSTVGHYFECQSDDGTDGFEIYQTHGSNTSRMCFIVNDNRTGSKSASFSVRNDGAVTVAGALSKGSGSFKIDHPIKPETHDLVHSFIEGPQADLIYRGRVTLEDGVAEINIDDAAGMTEGTFEALCTDVQCFTTNEECWSQVRGSVTGNILTIEAKDSTCNHSISWMVVGERCDPHMIDTHWTDEHGKVIVEPLKQTEGN